MRNLQLLEDYDFVLLDYLYTKFPTQMLIVLAGEFPFPVRKLISSYFAIDIGPCLMSWV